MRRLAGLLLAVSIPTACTDPAATESVETSKIETRPQLGLMSSLPILWPGNDAFDALARGGAVPSHWAVAALQQDYRLAPLDTLSADALARTDVLLLAQPRVLTPQENVALDEWVRAGGRALVLADPRLVGDYDLPLGDQRRPLDTALMSPILARWGLELLYDPAAAGVRAVAIGEADMAIAAAGLFRLVPAEGADCALALGGLVAQCTVGRGRVALLADATLVEDPVGGEGSPEALRQLLGMARDATREIAGTSRE